TLRRAHDGVDVAAHVEDDGQRRQLGAKHGVVGFRGDALALGTHDARRAHYMALVVRIVKQRLAYGVDAILEHAFALERQRRQRKSAIVIFPRLHFVAACFGEKLGPLLPVAMVDGCGVVGVELSQVEVGFEIDHGYTSITRRQYAYMPRISVSVTMWSALPQSRPPSSATARC